MIDIKKLYNLPLYFLDTALFILIFPIYFLFCFVYFRLVLHGKNKRNKESKLLVLPSSGSTSEVINKFGNLNTLNEHNPADFFRQVYICYFPSEISSTKYVNDCITAYDFRMFHFFRCLSAFFYMHGLVKIVNSNGVSIVRSLSPYTVGLIGRLVAYIFDIPFCVSIHEDADKRYKLLGRGGERVIMGSRVLAKITEKFIYRSADMILPIRQSLAEAIVRSGVDRSRICVIPHGVDLNLFTDAALDKEFRNKINPYSKHLIVSVCRHSMDNFILDIVDSARLLLEKRNDTLFIAAGDGVAYEQMKRRVIEYDLGDYFYMPGYVNRQEAIKYWFAADVALCLMGGYSLIEAALAGKPVVSYDVEWHYELVINGQTGFLVGERDVKAVAEALDHLLNKVSLSKEYGLNIRRLAQEKHTLEITDKIKINCYKKMLGEN